MEELGELIIAIIILVVAFAVKLIEMASRKKMPLPLPEIPPEEVFPEEIEIKPEPKIKVEKPIVLQKPRKLEKEKPVVTTPLVPLSAGLKGLTREELQNGIILSTILGPPKSRRKLQPRKFQQY